MRPTIPSVLCGLGCWLLLLATLSASAQTPTPALTNSLVAARDAGTNSASATNHSAELQTKLESARQLRRTDPRQAEPVLVELLGRDVPEDIQQHALLELALAAQDQEDIPRAQQIYAQFLNRWPTAPQMAEVLLRQGQLFRKLGLNNLALAKFYAVMTSALVLQHESTDYYQRLVLLAQTEIAETHYQLGKYAEAAEFFSRLLKQNSPALNRPATQFRLLRALSALKRHDEVVAQAQDFLERYPKAAEQPEVRFELALALKQLGRNSEALQQVLALLQEQEKLAKTQPELWAYWQRRAGNEVANQLYREGDYPRALEIYLALAQLDCQPDWQLSVSYQIGLTYERLAQPEKALHTYQQILQRQSEVNTNTTANLAALFDMARWRADFVQWQNQAKDHVPSPALPAATAKTAPSTATP